MISRLPDNVLIDTPTGRFIFVGRVDARLVYQTAEGDLPTDEQLKIATQFGSRFSGLRSRSFASREEAAAFAASLGITLESK
jgi:hypothetical protein